MRKIGIFAGVVSALMLALPAAAQDEPGAICRVTLWTIKAGMNQEFEEGLKRHNDFHRQQNDTMELGVWDIVTGENAGKYYRGTFEHHWSDFDAEEKLGPADVEDSAKNLDPYLESGIPAFYYFMADVSRPPEDRYSALASLIFFNVKIGHTDEFEHTVKKFHEAIGKTNWPTKYLWYSMINGGEGPLYVLVLPRENWAAFAPPEKSFDKMVEEALGEHEADALFEQWDASLRSVRSEIIRYRSELSYMPASM